MKSLGLIEVIGFISAVEASDTCLKVANVNLSRIDRVGAGIVTVSIVGDVGAVKAAVDAAKVAVEKIGTLRSAHVIPRLNSDVEEFLYKQIKNENYDVDSKIEKKESNITDHVISNDTSDSMINESQTANSDVVFNRNLEVDIKTKTDTTAEKQVETDTKAELKLNLNTNISESDESNYINESIKIDETESKAEIINTNETLNSKTLKIGISDLSKYSVKELRTKIKTLDASVSANALKRMKKEELIKYFDKLNRKDN
ncbi:BMC domain-containing protein [Clostridioides mangenotii]|uniref:BMC domain-containing protein n=1 Tax=Metaclostridioides mangenotii TaxID=1540 RepID=UPI001C0FB509|nr:BMC domain-containing protein [Clostridioides mangenotii]MBU5308131.1 BMC domain-containing protein [Clostridioides mangenotii]